MRLETHVLPIAVCKSCRIRHSPNSGTVRRFPVLPTALCQNPRIRRSRILGLFAGFRFCRLCNKVLPKTLRFSLQRHKSSRIRRKPNSGTVRRFSPLKPAFFSGLWLGAFGRSRLYRCQSTPGPPMPCFVAQSFVLAAFATLVCQRNCVFLCKDTKAQEFGLCRILGIVMPVFCGTEPFLWHRALGGPTAVIPTEP